MFPIRSRFVHATLGVGVVATLITAVAANAQRVDSSSPRVVSVTAERFLFTPSELTVAPGTTIEFRLRSEDTAHGFRIIGQSIDVTIPKRNRGELTVKFAPPEPGTYVFECSRMCGAGHSFMRGTIRVRPETQEKSR